MYDAQGTGLQKVWSASAETCLCTCFILVPPFFVTTPLPSSTWILSKVNYLTRCAKNQLVTCHKRVIWDSTGLLSCNWSKITFIVPRVWQDCDSKFGEEDEKCCIWKCNQNVTHMWPIYDSSEIHMWQWLTNKWLIYDLSVTQPVTYVWFICDSSVSYPVTHAGLMFDSYMTNL